MIMVITNRAVSSIGRASTVGVRTNGVKMCIISCHVWRSAIWFYPKLTIYRAVINVTNENRLNDLKINSLQQKQNCMWNIEYDLLFYEFNFFSLNVLAVPCEQEEHAAIFPTPITKPNSSPTKWKKKLKVERNKVYRRNNSLVQMVC